MARASTVRTTRFGVSSGCLSTVFLSITRCVCCDISSIGTHRADTRTPARAPTRCLSDAAGYGSGADECPPRSSPIRACDLGSTVAPLREQLPATSAIAVPEPAHDELAEFSVVRTDVGGAALSWRLSCEVTRADASRVCGLALGQGNMRVVFRCPAAATIREVRVAQCDRCKGLERVPVVISSERCPGCNGTGRGWLGVLLCSRCGGSGTNVGKDQQAWMPCPKCYRPRHE
jgi:hypothetical protein